jgi:hypothetical protein
MRALTVVVLGAVGCGDLVLQKPPVGATVGFVQEVYIAPPPKNDVLVVLDGAAVALPHVRAGVEVFLRSILVDSYADIQIGFTTTDAGGCDGSVTDGRCGRLLAVGDRTVFSLRRQGTDPLLAALPAIFDAALASASAPAKGLEAAIAALSSSELFREDDLPGLVFVTWRPDRSDGEVDKWTSLVTNIVDDNSRVWVAYYGETSDMACDAKDDGRYAVFAAGFRHILRSACAEPEGWAEPRPSYHPQRFCFGLEQSPADADPNNVLVSYRVTDEESVVMLAGWALESEDGTVSSVSRVCIDDTEVRSALAGHGGIVRFDVFVGTRPASK